MESIPSDGDPLISVFGLDNAGYYLWLSPLLGAIFAVILTLMFMAGILKGTVFPDFAFSKGGAQGLPFFHFTWNTLPKTSEDYGKLFVWAFLAGFAERLVPDSLDRLSSKLGPHEQQHPPDPTPDAGGTHPGGADSKGGPETKPKITAETLGDVMRTGELPEGPEK